MLSAQERSEYIENVLKLNGFEISYIRVEHSEDDGPLIEVYFRTPGEREKYLIKNKMGEWSSLSHFYENHREYIQLLKDSLHKVIEHVLPTDRKY